MRKRFFAKVKKTRKCWVWTGANTRGYGVFSIEGKAKKAHRVSYEMMIGLIPEGLVLDHICKNTRCVNPAHLEPVTQRENIIRSVIRPTHCHKGHNLNAAYIKPNGARSCRICKNERQNKKRHAGTCATHVPSDQPVPQLVQSKTVCT